MIGHELEMIKILGLRIQENLSQERKMENKKKLIVSRQPIFINLNNLIP